MNYAVFVQKNRHKPWLMLVHKIYCKLFLRKNSSRINYLRDAGAKIEDGVSIAGVECLGSEPWLVEIGSNTLISGSETRIFTHDGGIERLYYMGLTDEKYDYFGKVKIGKNCFIGHGSIILKNVTIGDNCIIGAGAVVSKSIPSNSVAVGVPARVICTVEEYYQKNKPHFDRAISCVYEKRLDIERKMEKYERNRLERECFK